MRRIGGGENAWRHKLHQVTLKIQREHIHTKESREGRLTGFSCFFFSELRINYKCIFRVLIPNNFWIWSSPQFSVIFFLNSVISA